jgi:hypothetical protein
VSFTDRLVSMFSSPNRLLATIVGAGYILAGVVALTQTLGAPPFDPVGALVLGVLSVNTAQSLLHVLLGAALLIAGLTTPDAARTVNTVLGTVCLALGVAGLFLVGTTVNVLALNAAGNVVHFGTAAVLLAVGLGAPQQDPAANRA